MTDSFYWNSQNSLINVLNLSWERVEQLFRFVPVMNNGYCNGALKDKIVANMFLEPSTRTKVSFEIAERYLGATVINIDNSSMAKGETVGDTARTLLDLEVDMLVLRSGDATDVMEVAVNKMPIINAGSGKDEHPTQSLLDAYTILSHFKRIEGIKVLIVGDINHSRVAASDYRLLTKLGARVVLCGPNELNNIWTPEADKSTDTVAVTAYGFQPDVIMPLRMQLERHWNIDISNMSNPDSILDTVENKYTHYIRDYCVSDTVIGMVPNAMIMAPGPVNYDVEVTYEVATGPRSLIREQVKNGLLVRKALLYLLMRN